MKTIDKLKSKNLGLDAQFLIYFTLLLLMLVGCTGIIDPPPTATPTNINAPPDPGSRASCAPDATQITIAYMPLGTDGVSDEQDWVPEAMQRFNLAYQNGQDPLTGQPIAAGEKPICVTGYEKASGDVEQILVNAVLDPTSADPAKLPTIFQPAVSHWFSLANKESGKTLFDLNGGTFDVARAWVVIAIWKSRLDAIRKTVGYDDIGWAELLQVLTSPNGWQDYGITSGRCGVYYGHTDPFVSSSGLSTLISEFYASARFNGFTDRVLSLEAVNRPDIQQGVRDIEGMIRHYARNTTVFKNYIARGPDYVDFVALPENDLISINLGKTAAGSPPEPLVALYPKEGTFLHEHPFGIVQYDAANGGWTTAEQREAALKFTNFVLTSDIQRLIMSRGFRPVNPDIPLAAPFIPENGIDPAGPKVTLDVPTPGTIEAIQNSWPVVKKQADIMLLIDVSGSMGSNNKLTQAKAAATAFLNAIPNQDRVGLAVFSDSVQILVPIARMEVNRQPLLNAVNGLTPVAGTALYNAVKEMLLEMSSNPDPNRIRAIVLLSDGEDTSSQGVSLHDIELLIQSGQPGTSQTCQQAADPVVVFPVAYGLDSLAEDESRQVSLVLNAIARASGTEVTDGDPQTILKLLQTIASFF